MSEELKLNENVGAPQPDALAQIASVDPSPAVGGMHRFTPAMLSRLKKQRQLLSELEHALKNHEFCFFLQPKLLLAEITETMLAENASLVENTIQGLHRKGFSVMMDDFGSGYSSLNMLKDTNVDAIKLDMKLIDMNQQNRSKGVQIVESVVDMAHRLNLPIIAEGVETPEQVSMLQAADCLYTQGYYFYKPMPVENAEALLAQPNSEDYWDMRRDLLRRNRRSPISDSKQTTLALQAYQIFADNVLELSLLNLSTGKYRVIKRDPRLPGIGSDAEEDFAAYCERIVTNKVIHPDDAEMFTDQTDLEALRSAIFSTQQPEAYRFRKNVSGQFV